MTGRNYYNEFDPYAAQWLRNLIAAGHLAPGDVDTRSIEDVRPEDLHGYTQCHFFAGIGGWPLALDLAGWPRDRPVWTGSCPCQPFSTAGKGNGFEDERHLWPAWQYLVAQCQPPVIFGEQVASKAVDAWIDLVQADMEGMGYAFGSIPVPAAGIGAPHIRDRNYWVADAAGERFRKKRSPDLKSRSADMPPGVGAASVLAYGNGQRLYGQQVCLQSGQPQGDYSEIAGSGRPSGMADAKCDGIRSQGSRSTSSEAGGVQRADGQRERLRPDIGTGGSAIHVGMGDTQCHGLRGGRRKDADVAHESGDGSVHDFATPYAGPTNGFWRAADWLLCRDGKWRPVEPGTFPLAHGVPGRVGRLRAYGNAIVPQEAAEFIQSYLDG